MEVRCSQLPNRFGDGPKTHPSISGFININVCSSSRQWSRQMSPMIEMEFLADNEEWKYFENWWQAGKIYSFQSDEDWEKKREEMRIDNKPHRRSYPKKMGSAISSSYHGRIYDYLSSRIKIYCTNYVYLYEDSTTYKKLFDLHQKEKINIIGFDGRDIPITERSLRKAVCDPGFIFGHELVICSMLIGYHPWEDQLVTNRIHKTEEEGKLVYTFK